ncbi:MAG: T9SS type A sorting domain-containing protein [Bacteroidales bacterium]|nr:T9SS type A sorting domain-containing protein [Bacteroidales bacterium]
MKKLSFLFILFLLSTTSFPDYLITRGPAVGEIYFIGPTYTGLGLYHSTDFGQTAICMDSLIASNIMSIVADKTEGYIYYVSYNESIYRSDNFGLQNSWEFIRGDGNLNLCSGVNEGFLYNAIKEHTEDHGNTFISHTHNGFFGNLQIVEIDQDENIGYIVVQKSSIPDTIYFLITYDKFENLEILNTFHKDQTKIGWLNRGTQGGELFSLSSGMQDYEGYLSYTTDYGYSWSLINILNIVDESIYTVSGVGGRQEGEYYILITHINNMWQNANTYILHSTDFGLTFNLRHPFSKNNEPLFANFSAKSNEDQLNNCKYDSTYFVSGEMPLDVQYYNYSIGDIDIYEWDFDNDGLIDSFEENPVYTYADTGWYSVNLTVYDGYDTNSFFRENYIYVYELTGSNEKLQVKKSVFTCYPNPFKKETTIFYTVPHSSNISFNVYDATGRLVQSDNIGNIAKGKHQYKLRMPDATPGVYYIILEANGNPANIKKVVVN